ncbi:glutamate receptor ionotropic, NMDA 3A-like [Lineus longissimus]|uniref:glutamate receptor ionotropic, NMDA 3A-like n=1 Tax=Lineus longissimus TaxID=88925 RepID=UPI00315D5DB2
MVRMSRWPSRIRIAFMMAVIFSSIPANSGKEPDTVLRIGLLTENPGVFLPGFNESLTDESLAIQQAFNVSIEGYLAGESVEPSPLIDAICNHSVKKNTVALISTKFSRMASLVAGQAGIPLLTLGTDYQATDDKDLRATTIRLEPPAEFQTHVIRDLMHVNDWKSYAIIADQSASSTTSIKALQLITLRTRHDWNITKIIRFTAHDLMSQSTLSQMLIPIAKSNHRTIVLLCNLDDTIQIFQAARSLGFDRTFLWIVTESSFTKQKMYLSYFPNDVIAIRRTNANLQGDLIKDTVHLIGNAVRRFLDDGGGLRHTDHESCHKDTYGGRQSAFYRDLLKSYYHGESGFLSFDRDGLNARPRYDIYAVKRGVWRIKEWKRIASWENHDIRLISSFRRRKFKKTRLKLRVVTKSGVPFVSVGNLDDQGQCISGNICLVAKSTNPEDINKLFYTHEMEKDKPHEDKVIPQYCCYGMSIDLLERLSKDMKFDYDLYITKDNHSGVLTQTGWTGIVGDLMSGAADIAIAPLVITSNRSNIIDFSVPYFYTRFRLLIAKNEMKASIGAFMEPLHWSMWLGIFVTLHITALAATFYEWHSPYGLTPNGRDRVKVFSFPSALNLCWSILFSHTVTTKTPKCWSSRWLLNVWACFSLVFLASYTANLAAFMVGEKTTSKLTGINDYKIRAHGYRCAAVKGSDAEAYVKANYPDIYRLMVNQNMMLLTDYSRFEFNQHSGTTEHLKYPVELIRLLRDSKVDLLILESVIADYYMKTMHTYNLRGVGQDFGHQMYGVGLPKNSAFTDEVSLLIARYETEGFLEGLYKLWTQRMVGYSTESTMQSIKLNAATFAGVFLLFGVGIGLGCFTLLMEIIVFKCCVPCLRTKRNRRWILPYSQRLYRAVMSEPYKDKITYTERLTGSRHKYQIRSKNPFLKPLGERLTGPYSRSVSGGDSQHDMSRLLLSASNARPDPLASRPLLPVSNMQKSNNLRPKVLNTHNIAIQTDTEARITTQLRFVDDNIDRRLKSFEVDMMDMREQLARALRDKEELLRKLSKLESKPVQQIEQELRNSRGAAVKPSTVVPLNYFSPKPRNVTPAASTSAKRSNLSLPTNYTETKC